MENNLKTYMIKPIESNSIDEVMACFDSKEKAEAFLSQFKTRSRELEIVELTLNPEYVINKEADPYLVSLKGIAETDPLDADIHYYIEQAESAKNKECSLTFLPNDTIDDGYFEMMLFAASKEEAVAQAIKKRDKIVASGEWEKAYMALRQ